MGLEYVKTITAMYIYNEYEKKIKQKTWQNNSKRNGPGSLSVIMGVLLHNTKSII